MNLQDELDDGTLLTRPDDWRQRHVIRFSHIDGAGIVFYPRYFEMLADSFPGRFAVVDPVRISTEFRHPARLGEQLVLKSGEEKGHFQVTGHSAGSLCFELNLKSQPHPEPASWIDDPDAFVKVIEIHDWMTGTNGRLHLSRSYELTAVLMEDWFASSLGYSFATLHLSDGALVPTVNLETELGELPSSGQTVQARLSVLRVGTSSLKLGMAVLRDEKVLLQTRQVVVFVRHQDDGLASVPIPGPLAERLKRVQVSAEALP